MLEFALAVVFLIITPGPGVLSAAGVGAGFGYRAGFAYLAGLWAGNNLVTAIVISGVAAAALALPWLRTILLWGSAAYLLWLAAKIAFAGAKIAFIHSERAPGFWNGLALQPINPKAYAVNTALFSGFAFMPDALMAETAIKLVIVNVIWVPIHFAWLWAGVSLRRLNLAAGTQRAINMGMAAAMLAVVAIAVAAQL